MVRFSQMKLSIYLAIPLRQQSLLRFFHLCRFTACLSLQQIYQLLEASSQGSERQTECLGNESACVHHEGWFTIS